MDLGVRDQGVLVFGGTAGIGLLRERGRPAPTKQTKQTKERTA